MRFVNLYYQSSQSPCMFTALPALVLNICMLWSYCELTEYVQKHFCKYSELWSFPKSAMLQVLGGASHQPPTDITWRLLFSAAYAAICVLQNNLIWLNLLKLPMANCSSSLSRPITFCLVSYTSEVWQSL